MDVLGAILGRLGGLLGALGAVLGRLGGLLSDFGADLGRLGPKMAEVWASRPGPARKRKERFRNLPEMAHGTIRSWEPWCEELATSL